MVQVTSGNCLRDVVPSDKFRQIWRNHILGECILLADGNEFSHFTSLTLFLAGNTHFVKISNEYMDLLCSNDNIFIALTFECHLLTVRGVTPACKGLYS
jgi:hypothetical protein